MSPTMSSTPCRRGSPTAISKARSRSTSRATFAPQPGEQVSGLAAIRPALERFIALKPAMTEASRRC